MANALTPFLNQETGGFGLGFYNNARAAGFTPTQIAALLPGSGAKAMGELAQRQLQQDLAQVETRASAASNYESELNNYKSRISDYERRFGDYERQVGELRTSVDTYRNQFDQAKLSYEKTLGERDTTLKQKESDLLKAQAEAQEAQADAERYRDLSINSQLRDLRSGVGVSSAPQSGERPSLSSGVKRPQSGGERTLVDVRSRMDATDSVLNRKKPVVEIIDGPQGPVRPGSSDGASSGGASGGAAGYYARRFG